MGNCTRRARGTSTRRVIGRNEIMLGLFDPAEERSDHSLGGTGRKKFVYLCGDGEEFIDGMWNIVRRARCAPKTRQRSPDARKRFRALKLSGVHASPILNNA